MDTALDSEVSSFKQDLLSRLVKALRENRTHWHPQVGVLLGVTFVLAVRSVILVVYSGSNSQ